jgi:integrase
VAGLDGSQIVEVVSTATGRSFIASNQGRWPLDTSSLRARKSRHCETESVKKSGVGFALRRGELVGLTVSDLQERDGRAVFVDISGKGGRIRTVPVPDWVEVALRRWLEAAEITEGRIFRAVSRWGSVVGKGLSTAAVLGIVAEYAALLSLQLSPHDLRRTCAKLCRLSGGALEQIRFLLGHASVQTIPWGASRNSRWRSTTSWGWDCPNQAGSAP